MAERGCAAGRGGVTVRGPRAQGFVRSTTKYWVRTTDVSAVKHHILQHLPVFTFDTSVRGRPLPGRARLHPSTPAAPHIALHAPASMLGHAC